MFITDYFFFKFVIVQIEIEENYDYKIENRGAQLKIFKTQGLNCVKCETRGK